MKFAFYTNTVSPHQTPLAMEIIKHVGMENYRYVFTDRLSPDRNKMGWTVNNEGWLVYEKERPERARSLLESSEIVMSENRDIDLFYLRTNVGRVTIYESERWFKPWVGMFRLLRPSYFKMAWRFVRLLRTSDKMYYFPMGIYAARDMARLCGLFAGDLGCLFKAPKLKFEKEPGGRVHSYAKTEDKAKGLAEKYCLDKMRLWGYFVKSSESSSKDEGFDDELRILWVGRFLKLKHVDTIIRAVNKVQERTTECGAKKKILLDIYGVGPEEKSLKAMATKYSGTIRFYPPVPIDEVRRLMREHDVYVFASDGHDGWGAVVNEALEEEMIVFGTNETGASATILSSDRLFNSGDADTLANLLAKAASKQFQPTGIGQWSVVKAAKQLMTLCEILY